MKTCLLCPAWIDSHEQLCYFDTKKAAGLFATTPTVQVLAGISLASLLSDEEREIVDLLRGLGADDAIIREALFRRSVKDGGAGRPFANPNFQHPRQRARKAKVS